MTSMNPHLSKDIWLSTVLGQAAYRLTLEDSAGNENQTQLEDLGTQRCFIFAKVPANDCSAVAWLEDRGFHIADTTVSFEKVEIDVCTDPVEEAATVITRFARPEDEDDAIAVAGRAFEFSRFHMDPHFPTAIGGKVKAEWTRNFFRGERGDEMVVVTAERKAVGFLLLIEEPEGLFVIDLIAVDCAWRGRGIAGNMIAFAEQRLDGIKRMEVSTQITNQPSVSLYENIGFRFRGAQYVLHRHGKPEVSK